MGLKYGLSEIIIAMFIMAVVIYKEIIMKKATKAAPASDVDDYLESIPEKERVTLEKLRKAIKAIAPKSTEVISYRIPIFNYHGPLVGFAAFKNHCSFFVMSPSVMEKYKDELKAYDTAKATIHFSIDKPLPAMLVKKLVRARIKENKIIEKRGSLRSSVI